MTAQPAETFPVTRLPRQLRIWPALVMLGLLGAVKATPYLTAELSRGVFMFSIFGPMVFGVGILVWWMFASRATSPERWLGPLAVDLGRRRVLFLVDPSIKGMGFLFFVVPTGVAAVGLALVCLGRASPAIRVWGAVLGAVIGFAGWDLCAMTASGAISRRRFIGGGNRRPKNGFWRVWNKAAQRHRC